jgi:hypothetical protein
MIYQPGKVCKIIVACAVLHNLRRKLKIREDEEFEVQPDLFQDPPSNPAQQNALFQLGNEVRNSIRERFFH